jgi:anthranilate/para-aminobenzoate synthase component II
MSRHVDLGKKWLNFSIWESYTPEEKDKKMGELYNAVYIAMPLRSYVSFHPEAALTQEERKMIREWTGKAPF